MNHNITNEEIVLLNSILGGMRSLKSQGKIDNTVYEKYKVIVEKIEKKSTSPKKDVPKTKTSKLYNALIEVLPKKDVESLEIGESSKKILRHLVKIFNNGDKQTKEYILSKHKLSLKTARDIIMSEKIKLKTSN